MKSLHHSLCYFVAVLLFLVTPIRAEDILVPRCLVTIHQQVQVPSREAGVITVLRVEEGILVQAGEAIGRLDTAREELDRALAAFELELAKNNATNEINVRYAKAAWDVAKEELNGLRKANLDARGAVTESELRQAELNATRAELQIEQAQRDLQNAKIEVKIRQARHRSTEVNLARRELTSPIQGMVVELYRQEGEWVNLGDPVVRVLRIDRLRVEGFLSAEKYGPELKGKRVTVEVTSSERKVPSASGEIIYVSPEVEPVTGRFRFWALIENPDLQLRPGLQVRMKIHVKDPANAKAPIDSSN